MQYCTLAVPPLACVIDASSSGGVLHAGLGGGAGGGFSTTTGAGGVGAPPQAASSTTSHRIEARCYTRSSPQAAATSSRYASHAASVSSIALTTVPCASCGTCSKQRHAAARWLPSTLRCAFVRASASSGRP